MSTTLWQIIAGVLLGISTGGLIMSRFKSPTWIVAFIASVFLTIKVFGIL